MLKLHLTSVLLSVTLALEHLVSNNLLPLNGGEVKSMYTLAVCALDIHPAPVDL